LTTPDLQHGPVPLLCEDLRPLTPLVANIHSKIIENHQNLSSMSVRHSIKHVLSLHIVSEGGAVLGGRIWISWPARGGRR